MSVRMLKGKASTSSCTHTHTNLSALRSELWLLFHARAKGIVFYDVPVRKSWGFAVSWSLSTRGMLTAFVLTARAPREIGFSSLSAFAPIWISYWRVSFIVCVACVLVFDYTVNFLVWKHAKSLVNYRCDSTTTHTKCEVHTNWWVWTSVCIFNDINGQIQPMDILVMCSAYKWIAATITITRKVISTFLVMGRAWNTLFFLVFLVED